VHRAVGERREASRIVLDLLDAVEQEQTRSQRELAAELGIALGLMNAYLKHCIKKGLVKVRHAPARRYAYYLTPLGFSEKSRLTVEYLSQSFDFFRRAKTECSALFREAKAGGAKNVLLVGQSDLAEIAAICAIEQRMCVVGIVEPGGTQDRFIGLPIFSHFDAVTEHFDSLLISDLVNARETSEAAVARFGIRRVLIPKLLRVQMRRQAGAVA
jgi:predicted transcriptional regulator